MKKFNLEEYAENENFLKTLAAEYVNEDGEELLRELAAMELESIADEEERESIARMDTKMQSVYQDMRASPKKKTSSQRNIFIAWGAVAACVLIIAVSATYWMVNPNQYMQFVRDGSEASTPMAAPQVRPTPGEISVGVRETPTIGGGISNDLGWGWAVPQATPAERNKEQYFALEAEPDAVAESEEELSGVDGSAEVQRGRRFILASIFAPVGWQIVYVDYDGDMAIFHLENAIGNTVVVLAGAPIYDPTGEAFHQIFINHQPAYMLVESTHSLLFFDMEGFQFVLTTAYDYTDLIELATNWI